MSKLMKSLSDEEISSYTEEGKGFTAAQCMYYISLCSYKAMDSGSCSYIFKQCGVSSGGGGCYTCTCR